MLQFTPLFIAACAFGACLFFLLAIITTVQERNQFLRNRLTGPSAEEAEASSAPAVMLRDRRMSGITQLNSLLDASPLAEAISEELAQAHVPLKVGEYLIIRGAAALGFGYVLWGLGGGLIAIIPGAVLGYFIPKFYVSHRRGKRLSTLDSQLVDALQLSANSLRAGWGFMQAMSQVATEMSGPVSEEFTQVLQEVNIGTPPEAAVQHMLKRAPSYDLELVMTAVLIQRQIGGNLAEMMDSIAFTIRERTRLLGDIASITAESQMSMWLLSLLPVGLLVFMGMVMPDYMLPFLTDDRGRVMLVVAATMEIIGVLIMRRLSTVKV